MNKNPLEGSPFDALLPNELAIKAEEAGVKKATNAPYRTFFLAITAGVFISIGFTFCINSTLNGNFPYGINKLIGGISFSLGLIMVSICGGELFTSSVLTVIAKASNKISWKELFTSWGYVYLGNIIGSFIFVLLIWNASLHMADHGAWGVSTMKIALSKLHHSFFESITLGILCNMMVCLTVWMLFSCRSVTDKVIVTILPISMFVACGFEHCVANMFIIPLAIIIHSFSTPEFWQLTHLDPNLFNDLTVTHFIFKNLIPVTIGNIIGGGFLVGMSYWIIYLRDEEDTNDTFKLLLSKAKTAFANIIGRK